MYQLTLSLGGSKNISLGLPVLEKVEWGDTVRLDQGDGTEVLFHCRL